MKKLLSVFLCGLMFVLSGCGTGAEISTTEVAVTEIPLSSGTRETAVSQAPTEDEWEPASKILTSYFSCTGNTQKLAEYTADILKTDLYEIIPEIPYTEEDLAYYTGGRADKEQQDPDARPAISGGVEDMTQYDTILLGYPIWHGQAPRIISTFLESYDFSGKTIIPFCTSHSSGIGSSAENLHETTPDSDWKEGKRFSADTTKSEMESWLSELGLQANTEEASMFYLLVNDTVLKAEFADNSSAEALAQKLQNGDIVIQAHDYGNFEKVGSLGFSLPINDERITTKPGDIILYQGNQLTVYYDENTWNFTRLGRIPDITGAALKEILGDGDVTITLTLSEPRENGPEPIGHLRDFLLGSDAGDLTAEQGDWNRDGTWSALDLTLAKKAYLEQNRKPEALAL